MRLWPRLLIPALALALVLAASRRTEADPVVLRMATIAPEGSGWAREFSAYARDVEAGTHGAVRMKIYFSGIGGDDLGILARIKRDQLDGAIGSESCFRLAPSMSVTRIVGLFQSREEVRYVLSRLKPIVDGEFLRAGFINMGEATLGPELLMTRQPVRDLVELRKTKLWVWELDSALQVQTRALGMHIIPLSLEQATRAYDDKSVDGFVAMPSAALAFQWSAQAGYLEDLSLSYRAGCEFIASRAFDPLPIEVQQFIHAASGKLRARMDDLERRQDEELVGGLFARQGLKTVPISERFRLDVFNLAREMRTQVGQALVSPRLLEQVLGWLADYRAEHSIGH